MSSLTRYRDMSVDALKDLIKRTENERAKHRQRHGNAATVESFDKQLAEAKAELDRRNKR